MKYFPYGECRNSQGDPGTDRLFTGQQFDEGTGLYYYGARYYDPLIGRFISADTIIPNPANPQCFNRYTYCLNNPLKYTDPTGHFAICGIVITVKLVIEVCVAIAAYIAADIAVDNILESRKGKTKTIWNPRVPDFSIPVPNEFNVWPGPGGGPELDKVSKIIIGVTGTAIASTGIHNVTDIESPMYPINKEVENPYKPSEKPIIDTTKIDPVIINPPTDKYLVIFNDGYSGYYTPAQIGAMLMVGAPIAEIRENG